MYKQKQDKGYGKQTQSGEKLVQTYSKKDPGKPEGEKAGVACKVTCE
jgi:hypothetical protein